MGWVHREGGQHREDRCLEEVVDPEALLLVELGVIEQLNAVFMQLCFEVAAVVRLLLFQQRDQGAADCRELLLGGAAVSTGLAETRFHLRLQ